MGKTIQVTVREVYGNPTVYPVCEAAKTFAQIAGTKTLTHATLCLIERLGYQIVASASFSRLAA